MESTEISYTERLAHYFASVEYADLPAAVVEKVKQAIRDACGCGVGGSQTVVGKNAIRCAAELSGGGQGAAIIGTGLAASYSEAAFCNALLMNAMDYDDTGSTGHPGCTLLGAAFAATQYLKAKGIQVTGEEFIAATALGYQAACRVNRYLYPSWQRYSQIHGIGSAQIFGAAVAAGKLLKLDGEQMADAMGIAGAFAVVAHAGKFGWEEKRLSWVKDNVARPAEGGLRAALLAQNGFAGTRTFLDGEKGFWVMAGSDHYNMEALVDKLEEYDVLTISFKPYPCCRWIHTTLDAVKNLQTMMREKNPQDPGQIEAISVYSIESLAKTFTDNRPRSMIDAEFSVPYCVAVQLRGYSRATWHQEDKFTDPAVLALADKVQVVCEQEYQQAYLEHGRLAWRIPSRVEIRYQDGTVLQSVVELASGSPAVPMTPQEMEAKFSELVEPVLGTEVCAKLLHQFSHLEKIKDFAAVLSLLQK